MKVYLFGVLLVACVLTVHSVEKNKECTVGQKKKIDCNSCTCANGKWVCTTNICSPRPQCISGQYKNEDCNSCRCINNKWSCISNLGRCPPSQRIKRGVPGAAELKHTPCAPNDYFKIDCNTCYCNIDKTGYLCTENLCSYTDSVSSKPLLNDTLNTNNTSLANVTVPQIQTITLNSTVVVTEDTNATESNSTNEKIEPLVVTHINHTKTITLNSTAVVIEDTNATESNSTNEKIEPLVVTHINHTDTVHSNSSNLSKTDGCDDFSCTPGQTFKKDCNTCTCTQDGKNAICTLKDCRVAANVTQ